MMSNILFKNFESCSSPSDKLKFLNSISFSTIIKEKNGIYYSFIPTLSLSAEGSDIEACYEKLQKMKDDHFLRLIDTDSAEDVLFSNPHFFLKGEWARVQMQFVKYLISGFFIAFVVFFLGWQIDAIIKRAIVTTSQQIHNEIVKIQTESKNLSIAPEEKKKQRIEKFMATLQEIKPYTDALGEVLFDKKRSTIGKKL